MQIKAGESTGYCDLFHKMYEEYKNMNKGYLEIIRAYLIELIVKVFR